MLSAIKYGWNYGNGSAQIDGRNILHTPSILRMHIETILVLLRVLAVTRSTRSTSIRSNNRTKYCQYLTIPAVQIPQILEVQQYSTSTEYSAAVVNPEILRVWHYPQYKISK